MRSTYHKYRQSNLSTIQCKEIIQGDCSKTVAEQFVNQQQQEIAEKCQDSLREDYSKHNQIKQRLVRKFFTQPKTKNRKAQLVKKFSTIQSLHQNDQTKRILYKRIKNELSLVYGNAPSSARNPFLTRQLTGNTSPMDNSYCRPFTSPLKKVEKTPSKKEMYSSKIDRLIEQSHKVKKYKNLFNNQGKSINKESNPERNDKKQKCRILDKIIAEDIDTIMCSQRKQDREARTVEKEKYEASKRKRLTNFQKYNMSFYKFIRQKTHSNIERSIYHDKIRQKDSYIQKFQRHILDQFKFSDQGRTKLERIFEAIESEYKGNLKKRKDRISINLFQ